MSNLRIWNPWTRSPIWQNDSCMGNYWILELPMSVSKFGSLTVTRSSSFRYCPPLPLWKSKSRKSSLCKEVATVRYGNSRCGWCCKQRISRRLSVVRKRTCKHGRRKPWQSLRWPCVQKNRKISSTAWPQSRYGKPWRRSMRGNAIIITGLPARAQYFVVSLEKQISMSLLQGPWGRS